MSPDVLITLNIVLLIVIIALFINIIYKIKGLEVYMDLKDEGLTYSTMKRACQKAIEEFDSSDDNKELEVKVEQSPPKKKKG